MPGVILRVHLEVFKTVVMKLEAEQFKTPPVRMVKRGEMKWLVKSIKTLPKMSSKAGRAAP